MSACRALASFSLVALASHTTLAQVTIVGGRMTGGTVEVTQNFPSLFAATAVNRSDIDKFDPVALLLSKKKDLKLDATQEKSIAALAAPVRKSRDSLFKRIDSIQKSKPTRGEAGDARGWVAAGNREIDATLVQIRQVYGQAANDALEILTPDQRPGAQALLEKLRSDMAKVRLGKAGG